MTLLGLSYEIIHCTWLKTVLLDIMWLLLLGVLQKGERFYRLGERERKKYFLWPYMVHMGGLRVRLKVL